MFQPVLPFHPLGERQQRGIVLTRTWLTLVKRLP